MYGRWKPLAFPEVVHFSELINNWQTSSANGSKLLPILDNKNEIIKNCTRNIIL